MRNTRKMLSSSLGAAFAFVVMLAANSPAAAQESHAEPHGERFVIEFDRHFEPPDLSSLDDLRFSMDHPAVASIEKRVRRSFEERRAIAQLERESRELAREARQAEGEMRSNLEAQLRDKLNEVFDKKLEVRRDRIARLSAQLEEERVNLEERTQAREEMINRRLRTLMGEADTLEW